MGFGSPLVLSDGRSNDTAADRATAPTQGGTAATAALGIITVYASADCDAVKPSLPSPDAAVLARLQRYELQAVVRSILPDSRVCICLQKAIPETEIELMHSPARRSSRLAGVMVCACLWICPVCAARISEVRRAELAKAIAWWRGQGGRVLMATFTIPHCKRDALETLLDALLAAYRSMIGSRATKALMAASGLVGSIRATEVTWGVLNGWHPHLHALLFVAADASLSGLADGLREHWSAAAARQGLLINEHGCRVQETTEAVDKYISKFGRPWGAEDEMVKLHTKRGRKSNMTPFDLLRKVFETGVAWPVELFREYAAAFYRHRQLTWSRGLKAAAGVVELTDQAIVEGGDVEDWFVLAKLSHREFFAVRRYRQVGQLLEIGATGDAAAVRIFLRGLVERLRIEGIRAGRGFI